MENGGTICSVRIVSAPFCAIRYMRQAESFLGDNTLEMETFRKQTEIKVRTLQDRLHSYSKMFINVRILTI